MAIGDPRNERKSERALTEETDLRPGDGQSSQASVNASTRSSIEEKRMDFILDIPLEISVELGRTRMVIDDLLKLGQGSVIELDKIAGETLEILANQRLIAKGEVVMVNEKYGVRLTEVISPSERLERLK